MSVTELLIIVLMLFINALLAAYELALNSVNLGRLKLLAEQKRKGAVSAVMMKGRMEASLAVVQIGITLAGALAAAIGGAGSDEWLAPLLMNLFDLSPDTAGGLALVLVVIPLSAITITFGELVPKSLAIRNSEQFCLALSPFMRVLSYFFYPPVIIFEWITKKIVGFFEMGLKNSLSQGEIGLAELRAQARALRTNRVLSPEQEAIILGASSLTSTKITDVLVPAQDIVTLPADGKLTEHIVTVHLEGYTRFPVTEVKGDPQFIIGYITIKELLFLAKNHPGNPNIREIIRPVLSLTAKMSIGEAFSAMMKSHVHLAIILDTAGKVIGMLTLEDILEEVVGDIQDEFDRLPRYLTRSGSQYIVGGGVSMVTFFNEINRANLITAENAGLTFSAWVKENHQVKIKGGDVIMIDNIKILVRKVRRNLLLEALIVDTQVELAQPDEKFTGAEDLKV